MSIRCLFYGWIVTIISLLPATSHGQIARSWNTSNGDWSNAFNWSPNGVPAFNDGAFIGNLAAIENDTVFLDQNDLVAEVRITDGMSLQSQGNTLTVLGDTTISGSNLVTLPSGTNVRHDSRITLIRGANADDYDTDNLTITDGGRVSLLDGAILEVDDTLSVDSDSAVRGEGVIRLGGTGTVYVNSGTLDPTTGGLTIHVTNGGALNLDGDGDGRLSISAAKIDGTAFDNLTINGGTLTDSFSGEINLRSNSFLAMNLDAPWSTSSGSTIRLSGNTTHPGPAIISGADLTLRGELDVSGSVALGQIDADTTFTSTANVFLGPDDRLEMTGTTDVEGGNYTIENNATISFEGPTTIRGGNFISLTNSPALDTSVALNGNTVYRGNVTFTGNTRQFGNATVATTSVINAGVFDMDGAVATPPIWNINAATTINADRVSGGIGSNQRFAATMNVAAGILPRLTINLSDPNDDWEMAGTMNLSGPFIGFVTKLAGSRVNITGDLNINLQVDISADANFASTSTINVGGGTNFLRMSGVTTIENGATFVGTGELTTNTDSLMSLEAGVSTSQVGLVNRGQLQLGDTAGVISVDRFDQLLFGTLFANVGKNKVSTDSSVLTISAGTADLAGDLQPRVVQLGGTNVPLAPGDTFTVLTAVGGVNGTFANVLDSMQGGQSFAWDVTHNPSNVVIELLSVTGFAGDYDYDGDVDAFDFLKWQQTFGSTTNLMADGNLDGTVNGLDLAIWETNYGKTAPLGASQVPEPTALLLVAAALLCTTTPARCRRERRSSPGSNSAR